MNKLDGIRARHAEATSLVDANGHLHVPEKRMKAMFASLDDIPTLCALLDVAAEWFWVEDEYNYRPLGNWPGKDDLERRSRATTEALMAAIYPLLEDVDD